MATKGEQTKQRILETLAQMFWKGSYHNVRVDAIVKEAQVNKASFYQYFKNKEQAAIEGLAYMHQRTITYAFDGSFKNHESPIKRLEEIFNRIYIVHKNLKENEGQVPGCPFVNLGNEMATDNALIRDQVERIFDDFYGYHQKIYQDAKKQGLTQTNHDPKNIGRQVQGILNGAMVSAKIRNRPEDIQEAITVAKAVMGLPTTA